MTAIACTDVVSTASPVSAPKKPRGRPAHTHDNRYVKAWLWRWPNIRQAHRRVPLIDLEHDVPTLRILPSFVDDVITGVARLSTSGFTGLPANRGTILKALLTLPEITTKAVEAFLNQGTDHKYSKSHVKRYTQKIIEASNAIDYHLERLETVSE
jgi:hypothetical protein